MRIAIDARAANARERTGVGYYTSYLLRYLPRVDPGTTYVACYPNVRAAIRVRPRDIAFGHDHLPNAVEQPVPLPPRLFEWASLRLDLPRVEWMGRFDLLFAPNFIPPPTRVRRLVLTVHDLAFRLYPDMTAVATPTWRRRLEDGLRRASRIIAVSEQTGRDLMELYGVAADVIQIVPLGVDLDVFRPARHDAIEAVRRRFGLQDPYLMTLGAIEPRKNLPAILRAFASLEPSTRVGLAFVGHVAPWTPQGRQFLRPTLDELPEEVRRRIVFTGYVADHEKAALLSGARALVYPSLYEGFGLPVIEAMACGTPVLTSNVSALPATAGEAALLVDPRDPDAIAHGITRLLHDEELRKLLIRAGIDRANGFSWMRAAERTCAVIHGASE